MMVLGDGSASLYQLCSANLYEEPVKCQAVPKDMEQGRGGKAWFGQAKT